MRRRCVVVTIAPSCGHTKMKFMIATVILTPGIRRLMPVINTIAWFQGVVSILSKFRILPVLRAVQYSYLVPWPITLLVCRMNGGGGGGGGGGAPHRAVRPRTFKFEHVAGTSVCSHVARARYRGRSNPRR
eukprot:COSAG03_NODE_1034_length_4987_cov_5.503069_2_plen_131_part_00